MLNSFKYFVKKYWVIIIFTLIINIPLICLGTIRTNKEILTKGFTTKFDSVVDVETEYEEKGSFSTTAVYDLEKTTYLQNFLASMMKNVEVLDISTDSNYGSSHLTQSESYKAAKIQYYSSIYNSIVLAYNEAKKDNSSINIDYNYVGCDVTFYGSNSDFRIGDRIIKIKLKDSNTFVTREDETEFRKLVGSKKSDGDIFTVLRDGQELEIIYDSNDTFGGYNMYEVNFDTISPKCTFKDTRTGGPSGGLLQTLSIYNKLTEFDYTKGLKIGGTGTINYLGNVGEIGGIKEKIPTADDSKIDIFFCPKENYDDALIAYNNLGNTKMKLVKVDTFYDALKYIKEN